MLTAKQDTMQALESERSKSARLEQENQALRAQVAMLSSQLSDVKELLEKMQQAIQPRINLDKKSPVPINLSSVMEDKKPVVEKSQALLFRTVSDSEPQYVRMFLSLVAEGEQEKAQALLKATPHLALASGQVTDLSKRTFKNITALQYAAWALDWHMWRGLLQYVPIEEASQQMQAAETGPWVAEHGVAIDWKPLLEALKTYYERSNSWDWEPRRRYWIETVGAAQLLLPAHVVNEYCHPTRSFASCPDFTQVESGEAWRTRKTDTGEWFSAKYTDGKFSSCPGVFRGSSHQAIRSMDISSGSRQRRVAKRDEVVAHVEKDCVALTALLEVRQTQRAEFIEHLGQKKKPQSKA